ncbi:hypothetical protein EUGRSUZ_E03588 [Eucalyptus grandis]|uniref:Uncharacterized protein n=2 Tax=Eucalyptus grandis TaxID=71139 RepID=A0ACC3KZW0_EUCGR|nr:hypothetical protein EUGRSUZ_E03588 [Eucalyptus grandis]
MQLSPLVHPCQHKVKRISLFKIGSKHPRKNFHIKYISNSQEFCMLNRDKPGNNKLQNVSWDNKLLGDSPRGAHI